MDKSFESFISPYLSACIAYKGKLRSFECDMDEKALEELRRLFHTQEYIEYESYRFTVSGFTVDLLLDRMSFTLALN